MRRTPSGQTCGSIGWRRKLNGGWTPGWRRSRRGATRNAGCTSEWQRSKAGWRRRNRVRLRERSFRRADSE
eukprot:7284649-Prymnesium_polylepis.1